MKEEGRIIDEANMDRWPGVGCHFKPRNFSPEELVSEVRQMQREFYSWPSMLRRLRIPRTMGHLASWHVNMTQRKVAEHSDSMNEFMEF
jgi:hypothetical protein